MDELHYVTYDPETIWDEMMTVYQNNGGEILYPGDEKEILLRSVQSILIQAFAGVDNGIRMNTLRYAVGDYLDVIGEHRNCPRIQAAPAGCMLTIAFNATGVTKSIPAGTLMSRGGLVFFLMEEVVHTGTASTADVYARCTVEGTQGNVMIPGMTMNPVNLDPAIQKVTVKTASAGGINRELDEAYRERIRKHMTESVTTGTKSSYESAVRKVSTDIVDVKAMRTGPTGVIRICLLLRDGMTVEARNQLVATVKDVLDNREVRPLGDQVEVYGVESVNYVLNLTYTVEEGKNIQAKVAQAVEEYKAWQNYTIGREYNPHRLVAAIYTAGAKKVDFAGGTLFNGQPTGNQYHEIAPDERCMGTVTVSAAG